MHGYNHEEIIVVYCYRHTQHVNIVCGLKAGVRRGKIYMHEVLENKSVFSHEDNLKELTLIGPSIKWST